MNIDTRFVIFEQNDTFKQALKENQIPKETFAFDAESKSLYVQGEFFSQNSLFELAELMESIDSTELLSSDSIPEAITKLYKRISTLDPENESDLIKFLIEEVNRYETSLTKRMNEIEEGVAAALTNFNYKINGEALDNIEKELNKTNTRIDVNKTSITKIENKLKSFDWADIGTPKTNLPFVLVNKETNEKIITNRLSAKYSKDLYEPIGIVVIPSKHNLYGTEECGVVSLYWASTNTPDSGSIWSESMFYGQSGVELGMQYYTEAPHLGSMNNPPSEHIIGTTSSSTYLPIRNLNEWNRGYESLTDNNSWYINWNNNEYSFYLPSPYLKDGSLNTEFISTIAPSNMYNIFSKVDGKENTRILIDAATSQDDWKTSMGKEPQEGIHEEYCTSDGIEVRWEIQYGEWYEEDEDNFSIDKKQYVCESPGTDGSTKIRCYFKGKNGDKIVFGTISKGEPCCDYLTIGSMDSYCDRGNYRYTLQGDASNTLQWFKYDIYDESEHYVEFCYSKDSSVDTQPDNATVFVSNGNVIIPAEPPIVNEYSYGYAPAACCCWRYHTIGTNQGDWYLPSACELAYIATNNPYIDEDIYKLQKHFGKNYGTIGGGSVFSSTQANNSSAILIQCGDGYIWQVYTGNSYAVRPFTRIKI